MGPCDGPRQDLEGLEFRVEGPRVSCVPMGHVTGEGLTLSVCSMVSRSSRGSREGLSILLMKVKSGSFLI